jgi:hypothetical protein
MNSRWGELEQLEEKLAESKGQLADLTHWRHVVLAEQTLAAMHTGSKSVAAAKLIAEDSKEYRDSIKALAAITTEEARLWFRYRRESRERGL